MLKQQPPSKQTEQSKKTAYNHGAQDHHQVGGPITDQRFDDK